jgi:hypothetical protein
MGKAMLILALGFSALFGTITLNMSRHSLDSVRSFSDHYVTTTARNVATSGVYMALSKLCQSDTFRSGFHNLALDSSDLNVDLYDMNNDPNLSAYELKVLSTATYENVTKSAEVMVGIPPDLADLAVFVTDTIDNVSVNDELGNPDPSLAIQNAPDMPPFDKDGLASLAVSQGHVHNGDFVAPNNYPNGNFYYDAANSIPNVTHVLGNFVINGNTWAYGIFIVEGNVTLDGTSNLEGVLYLPNPGSIVLGGGGNPNESNITGGVFANGNIEGEGNHISVGYKREYMEIFSGFQTAKNMYIISWKESPSS